MQSLKNIAALTVKELRALARDRIMLSLILYVFTAAVWMVSDAASTEVRNLSVGIVDEDQSQLSARITDAVQQPMFAAPVALTPAEAAQGQKAGDYVLVLSIPPGLERDLLTGNAVSLMLLVDATAVAHAGNGASFLRQAVQSEIAAWAGSETASAAQVDVVFRNLYNANLTSRWFTAVMQLMNNVTILMLILAGSSLIREREHGTIEHVLVMPVRPHEIALSKIFANGAVILLAQMLSLTLVVEGLMGIPVAGSLAVYLVGALLYVLAVGCIGLLLGTVAQNMGQFGLLAIPVIVVMFLLSGGMTPMESMPGWLQMVIRLISPAPHFVSFAQSVLYRGAGLATVWPQIAAIACVAAVAFALVLWRFRKLLAG
ncbi:ABC transporter permease [Frigidibacter sp.]|uniref:ABC transporter permease n=1 Tax=Frigidibacter sp. TaxID=2586418 RepID=UPI00273382E9|nr:ABC transporter permease [Frigidibacter sp.]MDP3340835.1 ABC transporter permease [Frigidibacter sp.]